MNRIFVVSSPVVLAVIVLVSINNKNNITALFQTAPQSDKTNEVAKTAPTAIPTPGYPLAKLERDFRNSLPIQAGEKLEYEVRFSKILLNFNVGIVKLEFLGPVEMNRSLNNESGDKKMETLIKGLNIDFTPLPDERLLHLRATVVSKGALISLLGKDIRHRYETLVDTNTFSARLSFVEIEEGNKHSIQSSIFDSVNWQVEYLTTDMTSPQTLPRARSLPYQDGMMSLLSAMYFARLQKYKEGQLIRFPVSYNEMNYTFDIVVGKREKIKTSCGQIKSIQIEPKLFGPGQIFSSRQGQMTMWMTDDNKHVPLRLVAKTSSGTIAAKLIHFKNNCEIIDREVKESNENTKTRQSHYKVRKSDR